VPTATKKTTKKDEPKKEEAKLKTKETKDKKEDKKEEAKAKDAKPKSSKGKDAAAAEVAGGAQETVEAAPAAEPSPKPKSKSSAKSVREPSSQAKVYQPANSYLVGEVIFHPVWKVEGTVIEVGKTNDGNSKIVVDFPDLGVRRLVAEHSLKI
jgi:hypothetical protein